MTRHILIGVLAGLLASCGETTSTTVTQLNLDRPTDITFACWGNMRVTNGGPASPDQPIQTTAQPVYSCDVRSRPFIDDQQQLPAGQEDLTDQGGIPVGSVFWFGFILQQGPGTVAISQFQTKPATAFSGADVTVLDADPLTPGKNSISVGEDPIALSTDKSGCKVVTANAGSCDLSVLDVNSALDDDPDVDVSRMDVKLPNGTRLGSRPAAMAFEPSTEVVGNACPATATGIAYVAYPSCHLVAAVDVATGTVVDGIQFAADGTAARVTDPNALACPDECTGGDVAMPGPRPVSVDFEYDPRVQTRRLAIGAEGLAAVTVVEIDAATSLPASVRQVALEQTIAELGVTDVAMSQQIGLGGQAGFLNDDTGTGGQRQFVYAVATDNTVRVVDVFNDVECDAQVDPRYLKDVRNVGALSCLPVGDAATPPRRAGARGPGIELTNDAIPTSVEIIRSQEIENDSRLAATPGKLIGHFAFISATNGGIFIANVDDDDFRDLYDPSRPLLAPIPLAISHQLRDAVGGRDQLAIDEENMRQCENPGPVDTSGVVTAGPRASNTPQRVLPTNVVAPERAAALPGIRQERCVGDVERPVSELTFPAVEETRAAAFPDIRGLRADEQWTFTWEGSLSGDTATTSVDGPVVRESMLAVDSAGLHLMDQTAPYCAAGVEPFDIVQFRGCDPSNGNVDCPLGYRCFVHPQSQVQGIGACMLDEEADRLADACKDFLTSIRRYTVGRTESDELLLLPRMHELRTTPLDGCVDDNQCAQLADYQVKLGDPAHPSESTATPDGRTYACMADPYRSPVATGKRCVMTCETTEDCAVGTVCQTGVCMEGVTPPQSCINAPQRYELRAGEAFTVLGTRSGYVHPIIEDDTGACVRDPEAHPLQVGRFRLNPPACDPAADPDTGALPGGGFDANPCLTTVTHTENVVRYLPNSCTFDNPSTEIRERQAEAVRFRNRGMQINFVDPTYPGDQNCIGDRQGPGGMPLDNVPTVYAGYNITFRSIAGFAPLGVPVAPTFPVKIVRGPTQSIWIVDQGDFLSTSIAAPSTRGKVFRVEPHALSLINVLE